MLKKLLTVFFATILIAGSFAQNQVITKLKQPPPNKIGIADLWSFELNNTTRKEIKGYITGSLSEDKNGTIVKGQSKLFVIKPGRNSYTYKDFSDADIRYNNTKYKEILLRTGSVPDGDYTICVEVYNENGDLIGIENCIYHSVRQLGNISLLSPADGDEIDLEQPIIFSWTPLPDAKEYSLKIVELIGNQSPVTALEQNPPFFTKANIKASQFQYPLNERKFQSEKSYAWVISSNGVLSDIGLFTVKPSVIVSSDKLPTKYRITLMYPDGGIDISEVGQLQNDLEQTVKSMKIDSGMPNRISMNVSIPKQTQQPSFGERSSSEIKQLGESLFNLVNSVNEFPFGDDVIVLVGKQSGGGGSNCPPSNCGCDKSNLVCSCVFHDNFCFCLLCPVITNLPPLPDEDVTLQLRVYNQPTITDSFKVVDVIMILADSTAEEVVKLKKIISEGLGIVDGLRKSYKIDALVIKQKYDKGVNNTNTLRDVLLSITETILIEYENGKFARLSTADITVNEEGLEGLLGNFCVCEGQLVFCSGSQLNDCEKCCKTAKALERDIVNMVNPGGASNDPVIIEKINQALKTCGRGYVVGKGGVAR